jgi:alginate O-acetyltransferase complex protein AlgJ
MTKRFSAYFILLFMIVAAAMAAYVIQDAVKKTESPTFESIWVGKWSPTFEKSLNESLPVEQPSRGFWGSVEYALFGEGRKGVLVGNDGWLFTDEEFSCLPHGEKNMQDNLAYVKQAYDIFKAKNIELVVAVIPAKVRLYPEYLGKNIVPACRTHVYDETVNAIASMGIRTQGLLPVMQAAPDKANLFLKTDTHWTPEGARMAAVAIAETMTEYKFPEKAFKTGMGEDKIHEGDLLRYLPGVGDDKVKRDLLKGYTTDAEQAADASADLFSQDIPPVTLVGTSYSANPLWNFPGFLKEFLKADVLNMADEGLGPFTVMEKYLESKALQDTAPAVVIWEIPERYMTTKPEFKKK